MYDLIRKSRHEMVSADDEEEHAVKLNSNGAVLKVVTYLLVALSICANILLLSIVGGHSLSRVIPKHNSIQAPYSPAQQAVSYKIESVNTHPSRYLYGGPPGAEFDLAWSELLWPTTVWTTAEELRKAGKKSLKMRNDDRYIAYLEVYHQLHCIKRIVQYQWRERYPGLVETGKLSETHFNHCIEVLRRGVMCNADASLNTWTWDSNSTERIAVSDYPRKCVDWDNFDRWARSRAAGAHVELLTADQDGFLGP